MGAEDISPEHLAALCPELAAVVDDATAHGNPVVATWTTFGRAVQLTAPTPVLVAVADEVRAELAWLDLRDPHYWLGEVHCRRHPGWMVVLPFGTGDARAETPAQHLPPHGG